MLSRCICTVTLIALLNSVIGCTSNVRVSLDEVGKQPNEHVKSVILISGEEVKFDIMGGTIDHKRRMIVGVTKEYRKHRRWIGGDSVEIKLSDVKYVRVKKVSAAKTVFGVIGGLTVLVLVVGLIALGGAGFNLYE